MALRREPFEIGEWYHCFNRGVDKRRVFTSRRDYQRFQQALYLCNSRTSIHQSGLRKLGHSEVFSQTRSEPLVSIAAYCLMPNHFHLVLQEITDDGITSFMQKIGTAYTMYFNIKNERTGNLFLKPFRAKRISTDPHFIHIPHYVHCNPAELYEPGWKRGVVRDLSKLRSMLQVYQFSSLLDYYGPPRAEHSILDKDAIELLKQEFDLKTMLQDATEYYRNLA